MEPGLLSPGPPYRGPFPYNGPPAAGARAFAEGWLGAVTVEAPPGTLWMASWGVADASLWPAAPARPATPQELAAAFVVDGVSAG
jgi:hypothetical protein